MEAKNETTVVKIPLNEQLHDADLSLLKRYQLKSFGDRGLVKFFLFELITFFFGNISSAPGYLLRKWFYPGFFKKAGAGIIFGKGCAWRHPGSISLGHRVAFDDYSLIDASGSGTEGVVLNDDSIISRNCIIQGKTGPVRIGKKTDIGSNTMISSVTGVTIGKSVLIAGNCYIGGARYISDTISIPIMEQGVYSKGPIIIADGVWLGAGVIVLDGVKIGKGCIVGAGSVVTKNLPDFSIAAGVPARIIRMRDKNN